jgi:hypothetical protein
LFIAIIVIPLLVPDSYRQTVFTLVVVWFAISKIGVIEFNPQWFPYPSPFNGPIGTTYPKRIT